MENKLQLAKSYNFLSDLSINNYVDCKDTVNHWCVGEICDIDNEKNQIKVHFEGWTPRYDEVMPLLNIGVTLKYGYGIVDKEELIENSSFQETHRGLYRAEERSVQTVQDQLLTPLNGKHAQT